MKELYRKVPMVFILTTISVLGTIVYYVPDLYESYKVHFSLIYPIMDGAYIFSQALVFAITLNILYYATKRILQIVKDLIIRII